MPNSFSDLVAKSKNGEETKPKEEVPQNAFSKLKNTIANRTKPQTGGSQTGEVDPARKSPPASPVTVSKGKGFNLKLKKSPPLQEPKKETTSLEEQTEAAIEDKTEVVASTFSEEDLAAEFNSEDQADKFQQAEIDNIREKLQLLEDNIDDKDIVQNALKIILTRTHEHEFLQGIFHPEDLGLMVRAMRESYGVTVTVKKQRSTKRKQVAQDVSDVMDEISDLGEIEI